MSRLPTGGLIDRSQRLDFTFDGKRLSGFAGDTLASALVASDVKLVGRSFKYHRPRGILTAGSEEPNALVTLHGGARSDPNCRATMVELFGGLEAKSQNNWPSLKFDALAVNQTLSPIFVAGFYYKTFMWPAALWEKLYEPLIRRAAGLGALSMLPDPDSYEHAHDFCDVLVIGAGPAGLAAALTAGRAGLRVTVLEEDFLPGGYLLGSRQSVNGMAGSAWAAQAHAELQVLDNVRTLTRTSAFGIYDGCQYGALERVSDHLPEIAPGRPRQRLWKIVAKQAILATGAIERPIAFGGNDRPGVMTAAAVSKYINRFGALPGRKALVFTACDSGWDTASDLLEAGASVTVVDPREEVHKGAELQHKGAELHLGAQIVGTKGAPIRKAEILLADGGRRTIDIDLLAMSGGWNPAIGLASNLGHRPQWNEGLNCFLVDQAPPELTTAGAANGSFALGEALRSGAQAAADAVEALGRPRPSMQKFTADDDACEGAPFWFVPESKGKAFVDFQNDVTDKDMALAVQEGFTSVEHLKRYTTWGMATDQGKTSQMTGHALLAAATGKSIAEAGTVLSRPPYQPVALAAFAGHHRGKNFRPERLTPAHDLHKVMGAEFVDTGLWKRPRWYAREGESDWLQIVNREVAMTRGGVGVCDVSTLGKIELQGPDAATLIERLYVNSFARLPVGKTRYGVMLREDGLVMDDGTVTRFGQQRFYITTTTANAARVMQHIDFATQVLWPDLDVQAISVTEQWAAFAVAGPHSRKLLQRVLPDFDLSNEAFPFMAAAPITWKGTRSRLFRVSFSGELAYEIAVPANRAEEMLEELFTAGRDLDVVPYGSEALGVMRVEKGHAAGPELNGQTTAEDLGMGRMVSGAKDFVGRELAQRPGLADPARPALVGLKPIDQDARLRAGAHVLSPGAQPVAENDQGHVTSAAFSPTLGHSIALALVANGRSRFGEQVELHDPIRGAPLKAVICNPVFVDPQGERLRG